MGEFAAIFDLIMVIFECVEDRRNEPDPEAAVKDELAKPKRKHYRAILANLRENEDLHGRELREEADEVFAMLKEADGEDISDLVDDAVRLGAAAKAIAEDRPL